jgi:hypothetical protein
VLRVVGGKGQWNCIGVRNPRTVPARSIPGYGALASNWLNRADGKWYVVPSDAQKYSAILSYLGPQPSWDSTTAPYAGSAIDAEHGIPSRAAPSASASSTGGPPEPAS